jgi:hypothetical protein
MNDEPQPAFDAWNEAESPKKPDRSRRTGVILIGTIVAVMVCLLALLAAWDFGFVRPTAERRIAEATATVAAQETVQADKVHQATEQAQIDAASTAQAQSGVIPLPGWRLRVDERFERQSSGWYESYVITEGFDRTFDAEIRGGMFFMHLVKGNSEAIWANEIKKISDLDNGLILIDAERVLGDEDAPYGIGFRKSESGYYFFGISQDEWSLYQVDLPDEKLYRPLGDGELPDREQIKHLAVLMDGEQVALYINGVEVGSFSDITFNDATEHSIALVATASAFDFSRISFDNLLIFAP